jgi:hypothetical protein
VPEDRRALEKIVAETRVAGKKLHFDLAGQFKTAQGNFLVLVRWFRHVER